MQKKKKIFKSKEELKNLEQKYIYSIQFSKVNTIYRSTHNQKDNRNNKQSSKISNNKNGNNKMCDYNVLTTTEI